MSDSGLVRIKTKSLNEIHRDSKERTRSLFQTSNFAEQYNIFERLEQYIYRKLSKFVSNL